VRTCLRRKKTTHTGGKNRQKGSLPSKKIAEGKQTEASATQYQKRAAAGSEKKKTINNKTEDEKRV